MVAGFAEVIEIEETLVAEACNHPCLQVIPFRTELIRCANGLTLKEIEEVLIQALPYVGYPAIATALAAAAEVIKRRGLDVDENYAGHRGLL
jgi:alkylhydroperoxidase/carboxymuconolactone decarboxylase family protein YurZ